MDQINAASLFYVKYKKTGLTNFFTWSTESVKIIDFFYRIDDVDDPWQRTALTTDNYMEVADLDRGTRYTVVLVATTGTEEKSLETDSDSQVIKTAGQGKSTVTQILLDPLCLLDQKKNKVLQKSNGNISI